MSKLSLIVILVAAIAGGVYCYMNYELEINRTDDGRLEYVKIVPRAGRPGPDGPGHSGTQPGTQDATIRIATFNLTEFDEKKLARRRVADVLVHLIPRFDIVAVQDIQARNQGILVKLLEQIGAATGRQYRFAVGEDFGRDPTKRYSAFLFDTARIGIDHSLANTIDDPAGLFRHKPLVASFRALGPDKEQAFTFKLVNVHTDRDHSAAELDLLDDVFRAVRDDGAGEDDVILLGDFGADEKHLGQLGELPEITSAVADVPTTLHATGPVDNILFDRRATAEFTGRAEVFDLMREFNLTMREALEVSDHLPVWAEFSSCEGPVRGE